MYKTLGMTPFQYENIAYYSNPDENTGGSLSLQYAWNEAKLIEKKELALFK